MWQVQLGEAVSFERVVLVVLMVGGKRLVQLSEVLQVQDPYTTLTFPEFVIFMCNCQKSSFDIFLLQFQLVI